MAATDEGAAADPASAGVAPEYEVGDIVTGVALDETCCYFLDSFEVRAVGTNIEVWVQTNLAFPDGDPRPTPTVTDEQIAYLVDQFDNNIYPTESSFWRTPLLRDGSNNVLGDPTDFQYSDHEGRVIAMIENVEDDNFYDPTYPIYIAGFFSPTIAFYMDRNIITIDAYDWGNRVGGDDAPWRPADGTDNDRPFLYEGVFAHEYQHLLHGDQDPIEESWINEGLSDWTMALTGYGIPISHGNDASLMPENSLVNWGDQGDLEILADYGIAFEFMQYLFTHFGAGVMHSLFESQLQGIASVNEALAANGIHKSFSDVYHDFAIARLILNDKPGHGRYNIPDVVDPVKLRNDDGTVNTQAFDTPGAPPWGSDYLLLNEPKKIKKFTFDGLDMLTLETQWTAVDDPLGGGQSVLWSGGGDMQDRYAIFEATGGGTLSFLTLYDLEANWDFGIVQVSTNNGATWTTIGNGDTTSDYLTDVPAIFNNLPGLTGFSGGWVPESYDLSAFSGPILIGLRFMSDEASNGNFYVDPPNWYVDDVTVDGQLISDGSDTAPFHDLTFYQPVDLNFTVDLVTITQGKKGPSYQVFHVFTDEDSERSRPVDIRKAMASCSDAVLIVTYDALQGQTAYAPYEVKTYQVKPHRPHDPPHHWRPRFPHWPHAPHWNMGH